MTSSIDRQIGALQSKKRYADEGSKLLRSDGVEYHKTSSVISTAFGILCLFPVSDMI